MSPLRRPFCRPQSLQRRKLRNLFRPWGPCPYHLPPQNQSPWTPPPEPLHPSHPTGYPSKKIIFLLFIRVRNAKNTTQVAKFAPSLGPVPLPPTPPEPKPLDPPPEPLYPPPPHRVSFKKKRQKYNASCEICSVPGPVPLPPTPPAPKSLDPPSRALVSPPPQGILQKKSFFFFFYT